MRTALAVGTERVVISGMKSSWRSVTSGVLQGSLAAPWLFNLFIHELDEGTESTFSKYEHYTKLGGVADRPDCYAVFQKDLNRQERQADENIMKFK